MRRPWNIPSLPVHSLAVTDAEGKVNMNICTYVMAISMKPKQYAIAVYHGTKTLDLIEQAEECVLQLLSERNADLVRPLGKRSGRAYDKSNYLQKRDRLTEWKGRSVLRDINAAVALKKIGHVETGGDHALYYFEALTYSTFSEADILTTDYLIEKKIIL